MQIELSNLGKRYNREWIFKGLSFVFKPNSKTAIIGSNGSGKSTLLKIISAAELPSSGALTFQDKQTNISASEVYTHMSFAAPYMDLPEQLNSAELFEFHSTFTSFQNNLSLSQFLELLYLSDSKAKPIRDFSSGMKQRLKLGLAICSSSSLLILDEPCSNLDQKGTALYKQLLEEYGDSRTILIGSNEQESEILDIKQFINVMDFK